MKFHHSAALCAIVVLQDFAGAIRLSLRGQTRRSSGLVRRGNIFGSSSLNGSTDIQYITNLTLNGQTFETLIDTGSSDLWVAGSVPNAQDTGKTSGVMYAVGEVKGPIKTAQLQFAGYTVDNQAYLEITPDDSENKQGTGLIGLGPSSGSNILATLTSGSPALDRIFQQNKTTPNFLTILLDRSDDPDQPFPGDLSVGEVIAGFENVTDQPKLPISEASSKSSSHWQALLDKDGIIGPDGKTISVKSVVDGSSDSNRATVVFDSGFSLPQVPKSVSDAIYSGVSGSKFQNITGIGGVWTLPCDQELNITFVFSGVKIPIHPLDTNMNGTDLGLSYDNGDEVCIGPFQPVSFDSTFGGSSPSFDMILGMAFLRNAYLLINYGDYAKGTSNTADPYIQLLSTTNDTANAHQDFVKLRLGGKDTTTNKSNSTSSAKSNVKKIAIIGGAVALGAIALLVGFCLCCCRKRGARAPLNQGGVMGFGGQSYRPLNDPAPHAAVETHAMPNLGYNQGMHNQGPPAYGGQHPQGGPENYQTAWDHRF